MTVFSRSFARQASERAVKTFAQVCVALLTTDVVGVLDVNWTQTASVAGLAALVSVLTSVASEPFGPKDSPSAV